MIILNARNLFVHLGFIKNYYLRRKIFNVPSQKKHYFTPNTAQINIFAACQLV